MGTRTLTLTIILALALGASEARASVWTPVASGTTETITAIEYEGPGGRFIFATGAGHIYYRDSSGSFAQASGPAGGIVFNDIEMHGLFGYAVGNANQVWRTKNNGKDWTQITGLVATSSSSCDNVDTPFSGDLRFVRWADDNTVYMGGRQPGFFDAPVVFKSVNAAADPGPPAFTDVNHNGTSCKIPANPDDAFFTSANSGTFTAGTFGEMFRTSDGLASTASEAAADGGNGGPHSLAGDQANSNRQWDVGSGSPGGASFARTEDGWANETPFRFKNEEDTQPPTPYDISFAGGTVLVAGNAGEILNSIDGGNFFFQRADGGLQTRDWRAADLASGSQGAVGGIGGSLVISDQLNTVPDVIPPTGHIDGPDMVTAGVPATFTAAVSDTGGSGIDAGRLAWTTGSGGAAGGPSATFSFAYPGTIGLLLTFRDNAGNLGEARKTIEVVRGPSVGQTAQLPAPRLSAKVKPRRDRRPPFKFKVKGKLTLPPGISSAQGCTGNVRAVLRAGGRTVARRSPRLSRRCTFSATLSVSSRRRLRGARSGSVVVTRPGDAVLSAASAPGVGVRFR
jgi:photosystem II stability/assembly factor-like uncharacterized protein